MSNPTLSNVHVDFALSNVSTAILQNPNGFIADKVFPKVPVQHMSNKYFTFDRQYFNRTEAQKRAPGTEAAEKDYTIGTDTYSCDTYAIKHKIPDMIRANTDPAINLDAQAATLVTHDLLIQRDVEWAANYFVGGVWTNDFDGVASGAGTNEVIQWDKAASAPVDNILEASDTIKGSTGIRPNTLVVQANVFTALRRNTSIIELINGGTTPNMPAVAMQEELARILGLDRVLVFDSVQCTSQEGQAATHGFIGNKAALLTYAAPTPGLMTPTAGYTFSWDRYTGMDATVKAYREEKIASDWVEGETAYDMKLVSADLGFFWDSIVS